MNKLMIALGLLIITGLSFAGEGWQYPWQGSVAWRYACADGDNDWRMGLVVNYLYPYYATGANMYSLATALDGMGYHLDNMFGSDYYPAEFKADMLGFNSDNSAFRTLFNLLVRNYISATGTQGSAIVNDWLSIGYSNYYNCITHPPG